MLLESRIWTCTAELIRKDIKCSMSTSLRTTGDAWKVQLKNTRIAFELMGASKLMEPASTGLTILFYIALKMVLSRCEPILLEDIDACEEGLASGDLAYLDYVICMNTASVRQI